ncbi:gram-negative bacteria-binding protein 1 [Stomoxys calcitrans]|uniref:Uncharacterized protein n=1 Tax=Stomoxys calcitrans TaxID=35570 RepID=A0A1I8P6A8_STOCA|nr:gram-negative bacteria-binding protein 1 [Stomoxys calcitrans]
MLKTHSLATCLLILIRLGSGGNVGFKIESVKLELFDDKFRVSIPDDPDIKWVAFNININKEFRSFEDGQLSGLVAIPRARMWSFEFERSLSDTDLVYVWLAIQHNSVIFRDKQGPISVGAVRRGDPNVIVSASRTSTTTTTPSSPLPTVDSSIKTTSTQSSGCVASVTVVQSRPNKPCKGDLLFEDKFDQLNSERWTNEVFLPFERGDFEFVLYNGTAYVDNSGVLKIPATLYEGKPNRGSIELGNRCTSFSEMCQQTAKPNNYLPPIISGCISSKRSFNFQYGRIEVKAKLPKGDWLVPLIVLEPTAKKYGSNTYYKNGEIRIAFSRGNQNLELHGTDIGGKRLFGGVVLNKSSEARHDFMANVTLNDVNGSIEHFGDTFHLYSLVWKPDGILLSVDDNEYGKIKTDFKNVLNDVDWRQGADDAPLDQLFYITLGLSAGGHGDFPEHIDKPWTNRAPKAILQFNSRRHEWKPTWQHPLLEVDYVRVYAV